MVSPAAFVPLAEETGLIVALGGWVLRTACREAARWPGAPSVAVNVSAVQFRDGRLVETVREALAASGLPAGRLELEITESVLMAETIPRAILIILLLFLIFMLRRKIRSHTRAHGRVVSRVVTPKRPI